MKIALAQINCHIGNFKENTGKITEAINRAKQNKVDLIVFSELSICGYPPLDLLENKDFINDCYNSINNIAENCIDIAAIIGGPVINNDKGKKLFNSAFFLNNGKIESIYNKTLLPTYDIFDEYRYFEPNTNFNLVEYNSKKIAITICEDLWDNQPVENSFAKEKLYKVSPMEILYKQKPDFIINISASPFSYSQQYSREKVLIENAKKYSVPIFYVNQVGANAELIFDGNSMVINSKGEIFKELKLFEEDFAIIDSDNLFTNSDEILNNNNYISKIHDALILGIKDYFFKTHFSKAVIGLSGGIDSAVTLVLAVKALGKENVRVLLMPSKYSSEHSITDAVCLANNLNVQYEIINIEQIVESFENKLNPLFKNTKPDITEENIQARIRGTLLMAISNKFGNILLNTTNKSEAAVGYGTLYGDMNGGLSVLGDVYKTDVYNLADFINQSKEIIPQNTINKPPSAELRPDQKDSDSLPEYDILDKILFQYIEQKNSISEIVALNFDEETVSKVVNMVNRNEYKRFQAPPILRISTKAFGTGRRIPLVAYN